MDLQNRGPERQKGTEKRELGTELLARLVCETDRALYPYAPRPGNLDHCICAVGRKAVRGGKAYLGLAFARTALPEPDEDKTRKTDRD